MVKMYHVQSLYEFNRNLNKNQVVIYGCSYSAAMLYYELREKGIEAAAFIDSFIHMVYLRDK